MTHESGRARRRGAAMLVLLAAVLGAGVVYLIGALSDWSGRHEMPIQWIVGAIAILVAGILLAAVIVRRGN